MTDEDVEWREVPGWPGYRVSNTGIVQSCRSNGGKCTETWRTRVTRVDRDGYRKLNVHNKQKKLFTGVSVLVCLAFHGPKPEGAMALHCNGNRLDDRSENLRWGTAKDNSDDREHHGNTAKRERNGRAKITTRQAKLARRLRAFKVPYALIGNVFGVSKRQAIRICKGQSWMETSEQSESEKERTGATEGLVIQGAD